MRVLCVCRENTCQSPMFEAMLRAELQKQNRDDVQVESAGILEKTDGKPADKNSIACMKERGLDLSNHRSRWIELLNRSIYDLVICMDRKQADSLKEFSFPSNTKIVVANDEHGGILNPYGYDFTLYQAYADVSKKVVVDIINDHLPA